MESKLRIGNIDVYIEGKDAKPIVMIHGWPDSYRLWDKQVETLKSSYRCIRLNLPGFEKKQQNYTREEKYCFLLQVEITDMN